MDDLRLAALMCSKICHDLISPVGAFSNGVEVLTDDDDPEMHEHAMALLENSASQATAKLKFARLAYGSSGSRGSLIDLRDAHEAVRELLGSGKITIQWDISAPPLDKDVVKVLVNLAHIACDTIPRGGDLKVSMAEGASQSEIKVEACGPRAKIGDETRSAFDGKIAMDDLDVRTVLPHISGMLARDFGQGIDIQVSEEQITFTFSFTSN